MDSEVLSKILYGFYGKYLNDAIIFEILESVQSVIGQMKKEPPQAVQEEIAVNPREDAPNPSIQNLQKVFKKGSKTK